MIPPRETLLACFVCWSDERPTVWWVLAFWMVCEWVETKVLLLLYGDGATDFVDEYGGGLVDLRVVAAGLDEGLVEVDVPTYVPYQGRRPRVRGLVRGVAEGLHGAAEGVFRVVLDDGLGDERCRRC